MALVLVISSMLVLTLFVSAALAYAVGSLPLSRHDQDYNAALSAAQAGVDDYIRHLNQNDDYWQQDVSPDCDNDSLKGPSQTGCLYASTVQYSYIDDDGDTNGPAFHIDVDSQGLGGNGSTITVTSTGKVNGVTRTLQAEVGRSGSTQFVYYTDFEDADPANVVAYPDGEPADKRCITEHWYEGRDSASGCKEITFIGGDVLDGPVHTNDTPLMSIANGKRPEFKGYLYYPLSLASSDPACMNGTAANNYKGCWRSTGVYPTVDKPAGYEKALPLIDNADQMKTYPGCQYIGQTRIKFTGDGYMLVWSKLSTAASTTAACGGAAPWGKKVAVPDAQVIYVADSGNTYRCTTNDIGDGLPIDGDVNMSQPDQMCGQGNIYVQGSVGGRVTLAAQHSIIVTGDLTLRDPNSDDILGLVASSSVEVMHPWIVNFTKTAGSCVSSSGGGNPKSGEVWQGENWTQQSNGMWLVTPGQWVKQPKDASKNAELWQPGSWTQTGGVWAWTPGQWFTPSSSSQRTANYGYSNGVFGSQCNSGKFWQGETWNASYSESSAWPVRADGKNITIYASIQTLQHSFFVQSYDQGTPQGTVTVYGSIAQKYRGAVGAGSVDGSGNYTVTSGYLKSYHYDQRLHSRAPPYFPQWLGAAWSTKRIGEISPKY